MSAAGVGLTSMRRETVAGRAARIVLWLTVVDAHRSTLLLTLPVQVRRNGASVTSKGRTVYSVAPPCTSSA